jgi:hypothetical protein
MGLSGLISDVEGGLVDLENWEPGEGTGSIVGKSVSLVSLRISVSSHRELPTRDVISSTTGPTHGAVQ